MEEWFTAREIAALELPGLPRTRQGIDARAKEQAWPSRERQASGGGREYPLEALPAEARDEYIRRQLASINTLMAVGQPDADSTPAQQPASEMTGSMAAQRDARLAILAAVDRFAEAGNLTQTQADGMFCPAYSAGEIPVAEWVRAAVKSVTPRTLFRWRRAVKAGATARLAVDRAAARKGKGVLDTANEGKVKLFALACVARNPLLTADQIRDMAGGEFGPTLISPYGEVVALPPIRTWQRALQTWKEQHAAALVNISNPDRWKNEYRLSGSNSFAHITQPNQLWMIDASPADMLCVDGRYSIYAVVDIATRRLIITVSKTARADAVCALMRRAILAWGVPDEVKTDNGSDFVARHTQRVFAAIGIGRIVSNPYSPWEKGHVERAIRTYQHGCVRLLPGFIGHSVADRKVIEGRKSFAERLGEDPRDAYCVELSAADLQRYSDQWVETKYSHTPHEGLNRRTPFEAVAASTAPVRTVDERALDLLLAPVAGKDGRRVATKRGVRIGHHYYFAAAILPGQDLFVRMDEADMGRAYLFAPDGETYLADATCPELAGIDPKAFVAAQRNEQARLMRDGTANLRKEIKRQTAGPRAIDLALRHQAREAGALVDFPKPTVAHTTPALDAAAQAAAPREAPKPQLSDEMRAMRAQLAAEPADRASSTNVRRLHAPTSPRARWTRARDLERRLAAGETLPADDAQWLVGYASGPEYKGFLLTYGPASADNSRG